MSDDLIPDVPKAEWTRDNCESKLCTECRHPSQCPDWAESPWHCLGRAEKIIAAERARADKAEEELAHVRRELAESRGDEETADTLQIYNSFKTALEPFGHEHLNVRARIENLVHEWKAASISAAECSVAEMAEREAREKAELTLSVLRKHKAAGERAYNTLSEFALNIQDERDALRERNKALREALEAMHGACVCGGTALTRELAKKAHAAEKEADDG